MREELVKHALHDLSCLNNNLSASRQVDIRLAGARWDGWTLSSNAKFAMFHSCRGPIRRNNARWKAGKRYSDSRPKFSQLCGLNSWPPTNYQKNKYRLGIRLHRVHCASLIWADLFHNTDTIAFKYISVFCLHTAGLTWDHVSCPIQGVVVLFQVMLSCFWKFTVCSSEEWVVLHVTQGDGPCLSQIEHMCCSVFSLTTCGNKVE